MEEFFEQLKYCLDEGLVLKGPQGFYYRPKSAKKPAFGKKVQFEGDEYEEKAYLSLKDMWNKYAERNKFGVKGWVVEEY